MKSILTITCSQSKLLFDVLREWLKIAEHLPSDTPGRLTPLQVLAFGPLKRLLPRFQQALVSTAGQVFSLTLALPELLGLYYCLPWSDENAPDLTSTMQELHKLLLGYGHYVELA